MARLSNLHGLSLRRSVRGVTLIELLVSVALTLIVVLAVVRVFDLLGRNVTESRSILELSAQLRSAAHQLQSDLDRLTTPPRPPADPLVAPGYFEIIEGKRSDANADGDDSADNSPLLDTDPADLMLDPDLVNAPWPSLATAPPLPGGPTSTPYDPGLMLRYLAETRGIIGDVDDVLMGTIRSVGQPFRGRFLGQVIESPLAEVVWWVEPLLGPTGVQAGVQELILVRRQLLILPSPEVQAQLAQVRIQSAGDLIAFLQHNDLSVRPDLIDVPSGQVLGLKANSLADLTYRRNRFAHWRDVVQSPLPAVTFADPLNRAFLARASDRSDIMANDVLAMDVRVFDPLAPVVRPFPNSAYALTPGDPGFWRIMRDRPIDPQTPSTYPESLGAYVDLGYNVNGAGTLYLPTLRSHFSGPPRLNSRTWLAPNAPRVYCTWCSMYERDGIDQNGNNLYDEGYDGFDTGMPVPAEFANSPYLPQGIVDDVFENETSPPYPHALRGAEVVLRLREANTTQVRQASVVADFPTP